MDWGEFKQEFGSHWRRRSREKLLQNSMAWLLVIPFVCLFTFHALRRHPEKPRATKRHPLVGAALGPGLVDKRAQAAMTPGKMETKPSEMKSKIVRKAKPAVANKTAKKVSKNRKIASTSGRKSQKLFKHKRYYKTQAGKLKPTAKARPKPISLDPKESAVASGPRLVKD